MYEGGQAGGLRNGLLEDGNSPCTRSLMSCKRPLSSLLALLALALAAQADDLHLKKNISVDGNVMSTSETFIKGARTRDVNQGMAGGMFTARKCDLKRTTTLTDQSQTYRVPTTRKTLRRPAPLP